MPPRDDLDEHFRTHPRLKKYAEMFDAQRNRNIAHQQRISLMALLLAVVMAYYALSVKYQSWSPAEWPVAWPTFKWLHKP
ncbi:MAG: hypothetical protein FJZ01_09830 [Candidatus Sericytochromatia bacterium]|nr:hypothetical protein [Candidatus Tanganyikabacteria bacterium]